LTDNERLSRLESTLENIEKTMISKADLAKLKTDIAKGFFAQIKWIISTAAVVAITAFTAAKYL